MERVLKTTAKTVTFEEILLDETICQGNIMIAKELVREAGGVNQRLNAKQKYELILRIAAMYSGVCFEEKKAESIIEDYIVLKDDSSEIIEKYGWQTDCYVIGKYSEKLREMGCFEAAVSSVLTSKEMQQDRVCFLEQMVGRTEKYYQIDDATRPILIYKGDPTCHNVLTIIAEALGGALQHAGEKVIYFDLEKEDARFITKYLDLHFKAVIGVQSYLFSIKMEDEVHYAHERIHAPQYNFIFDHPIWVKSHMDYKGGYLHLLTHDTQYMQFAKKYFGQETLLIPPAGMKMDEEERLERVYDLTFIGTYGDYWEQILWMHQLERADRFVANHFLLTMRKNPNMTAEDALLYTLQKQGIVLEDSEFVEQLYRIRRTIYCVMHYFRKKTIETLLKAGIQVDVFGDSWYNCPLRKYPNLVCHPNVTVEESLGIWKKSKLSLNVMSWHKAGFTERMIDIMLAETVLVTDYTAYLDEHFDEDDMVVFHLDKMEELPEKVKRLLSDDRLRKKIAERGREKVKKEHTWDIRARQLLEIINQQ